MAWFFGGVAIGVVVVVIIRIIQSKKQKKADFNNKSSDNK